MENIDLVIFDMAGTTVNEQNVVYKTLQKAINNRGMNLPLEFVLEHGAGKEKHQAIKDIITQAKEWEGELSVSEEIFVNFKTELNLAYEQLKVATFIGVEDYLSYLRGQNVKIALNTGYNTHVANKLLRKMSWEKGIQYDVLVTACDVSKGRPHPDMIFKAMKEVGVEKSFKTIKIGDSIIDIEEGKNANCGYTVGVTTGAHTRKQLQKANPSFVVNDVSELISLID